MRLKDHEIAAIRACAARHFGPGAIVTLFGSRVDDRKRGGDIDLHIVPETPELATFAKEAAFLRDLSDLLGEQRIDLIVQPPGAPDGFVDREARRTGVRL